MFFTHCAFFQQSHRETCPIHCRLWHSGSMPLSNDNNGHLEVSRIWVLASIHVVDSSQWKMLSHTHGPIEKDLVPLLIYQFQIDLLSVPQLWIFLPFFLLPLPPSVLPCAWQPRDNRITILLNPWSRIIRLFSPSLLASAPGTKNLR